MINFKYPRLEAEYNELPFRNPRLRRLLVCLSEYIELDMAKDLTITELYRSQAEFDALYAATPPERRPATSPHMRWEACDIRSMTFNDRELDKIKTFCNQFTYKGGQKPVCLVHSITGNALHVHIQYL